jgi:hypothetical protein
MARLRKALDALAAGDVVSAVRRTRAANAPDDGVIAFLRNRFMG